MTTLSVIQFVCALAVLILSAYAGYEFHRKPRVKQVRPTQIASQAALVATLVCASIREASLRIDSFWWVFYISVVFLGLISLVVSYCRLYRETYPRPSGKLKD